MLTLQGGMKQREGGDRMAESVHRGRERDCLIGEGVYVLSHSRQEACIVCLTRPKRLVQCVLKGSNILFT